MLSGNKNVKINSEVLPTIQALLISVFQANIHLIKNFSHEQFHKIKYIDSPSRGG